MSLAVLLSAPAVGAGPEGRILGRVIDGTAPRHPVSGQVVRLAVVERAATSERRSVSDAQGRVAFGGLPLGGIRVFILSTEYGGVHYESDRIVLAPDASEQSLDLVVYERARDHKRVRATVAFAVVDIARGGIRVSAIQRFENPTDRTSVPPLEDPLVFPLPPRAEMVTFLAGWHAPRLAGGKITDTIPMLPGLLQVAYTFGIEAGGPDLTLPWRLPYGASDVEILIADAGVRARGEGLHAAGTVAGPHGRYLRWSGGPVPPGAQVAVHLEGVPVSRRALPVLVAAALAVVLGSGLVWALRRPRVGRA